VAIIRGFLFPEELYYLVEKHVWTREIGGGLVRVGLTPVAFKLLRNSLVAITIRSGQIGREVPQGKSIAMVESLKYIGPLAAPFTGRLVRGNPQVQADPDLAAADPYGEGWIAEMEPADWETARAELVTGPAAMAAYRALLELQNISPEQLD
jgi:glycine cleavage system H protein